MAKVTYDRDADVLYVSLRDEPVERQTFVDDIRIIDKTADGGIVGVEFLGASDGVDLRDVPFAETIHEAINESGLAIKVFA